eukprot:TRINITY_DN160_c6_g1_i1.p1 TRINITY_DN160_c6_g1~~TRINITY_DN160_c6_g1_i1.p1  ORF type:complete len:516 (+),score=114.93 TRINITY_DN160_c6_g1_i1:57-1604(+)
MKRQQPKVLRQNALLMLLGVAVVSMLLLSVFLFGKAEHPEGWKEQVRQRQQEASVIKKLEAKVKQLVPAAQLVPKLVEDLDLYKDRAAEANRVAKVNWEAARTLDNKATKLQQQLDEKKVSAKKNDISTQLGEKVNISPAEQQARIAEYQKKTEPVGEDSLYYEYNGFLRSGNDVLQDSTTKGSTHNISTAKIYCSLHSSCVGFSVVTDYFEDKGNVTSIYYKSSWHLRIATTDNTPSKWVSFKKKTPFEAIKTDHYVADYNITAITEDGGVGELSRLLWPRYTRNVSAPAFEYPKIVPGKVMLLSLAPRAYFIPNFLNSSSCDALIKMASSQLKRSQIASREGDKTTSTIRNIRTSEQAWLDPRHGKEVVELQNKVSNLTNIRKGSTYELLQILRYEEKQEYISHHDYFDPRAYGNRSSNRVATTFVYLDDVESGGETNFPAASRLHPHVRSSSDCQQGLRVRPTKGDAVLFYSMYRDMSLDPLSLHGGCSVKKGVKWGATQWIDLDNWKDPTG